MVKVKFIASLIVAALVLAAAVRPALASAGEDDPDFAGKMSRISEMVAGLLRLAIESTMKIARLLYCVLAIAGAVLWTSRLDRFTGRDLIIGAALLAFVSEFVMPIIL